MRYRACFAALLLAVMQSALPQTTHPPESADQSARTATDVFRANQESVVTIEVDGRSGKRQGSAVAFQNGFEKAPDGQVRAASTWLFTNAHVLSGARQVDLLIGHFRAKAAVKYVDDELDLAILDAADTVLRPAELISGSLEVRPGAPVFAIGSPKGLALTISDGIISSVRKIGGVDYIQSTTPLSPGSSGGGLFSAKGALIGITSFKLKGGEALSFALDAREARLAFDALSTAEIIKAAAIDEKYHERFGNDFIKWLSRGANGSRTHYVERQEEIFRQYLQSASAPEAQRKFQEDLFEIAQTFAKEKGSTAGQGSSSDASSAPLNLVCSMRSSSGEGRALTFRINLQAGTVNGRPANIQETQITFSYGTDTKYNVQLDRIASSAVIGTAQFPALMTGSCTRAAGRAF